MIMQLLVEIKYRERERGKEKERRGRSSLVSRLSSKQGKEGLETRLGEEKAVVKEEEKEVEEKKEKERKEDNK